MRRFQGEMSSGNTFRWTHVYRTEHITAYSPNTTMITKRRNVSDSVSFWNGISLRYWILDFMQTPINAKHDSMVARMRCFPPSYCHPLPRDTLCTWHRKYHFLCGIHAAILNVRGGGPAVWEIWVRLVFSKTLQVIASGLVKERASELILGSRTFVVTPPTTLTYRFSISRRSLYAALFECIGLDLSVRVSFVLLFRCRSRSAASRPFAPWNILFQCARPANQRESKPSRRVEWTRPQTPPGERKVFSFDRVCCVETSAASEHHCHPVRKEFLRLLLPVIPQWLTSAYIMYSTSRILDCRIT